MNGFSINLVTAQTIAPWIQTDKIRYKWLSTIAIFLNVQQIWIKVTKKYEGLLYPKICGIARRLELLKHPFLPLQMVRATCSEFSGLCTVVKRLFLRMAALVNSTWLKNYVLCLENICRYCCNAGKNDAVWENLTCIRKSMRVDVKTFSGRPYQTFQTGKNVRKLQALKT